MKIYRIHIIGRVQGVAFRYYSKLKADEYGLFGTTENQNDGSVVIIVVGKADKVERFVEWCFEGSPASEVKEVNVTEISVSDRMEYEDFSILR